MYLRFVITGAHLIDNTISTSRWGIEPTLTYWLPPLVPPSSILPSLPLMQGRGVQLLFQQFNLIQFMFFKVAQVNVTAKVHRESGTSHSKVLSC